MIIIDGRVYVHITIDGKEMPTSANLVERITMPEGNGALVPALELILNDHSGHLGNDLALTDGNLIIVTIGKSVDSINTVSRQYRLFGHKQRVTASGPQIQVIATLDAPGYISSSSIESYKGTTSHALLEISKKSQMCYSGPEDFNGKSLDDSQIWRSVCESRASLAQNICRHGYIDEHSAMMLVTTSLGCLKYRNLSDVIETPLEKIKRVFLHSLPQASNDSSKIVYQVREAKDRSVAGLMNSWQNYGSTRFEHTLDGVQEAHSSVDVKTKGNFLAINSQVSDTVVKSRREYAPLDCGNTHKKYQRALYQNIKQLSLFSEKLSLLTTDVTDVQLLDPVIYRQADSDLTKPVKNSDIYIVIGKTILLKGGAAYAERLELARLSLTTKGESSLKCANPAADAASVTPQPTINPAATTATKMLPSVKSATAAVMEAGNVAKDLKNASQKVASATQGSMAKLRDVLSSIKTYTNPANILAAVTKAVPALGEVLQVTNQVKSAVNQVSSTLKDLTSVPSAVQKMSSDMRKTVLGLPNGVLDSVSYSLGGIKQLGDHARVLQATVGEVNKYKDSISALPGGAESLYSLSTASDAISAGYKGIGLSVASSWNSSMSLLTSMPVPSADELTNRVKYPGGALDKVIDNAFTPLPYSKTGVLTANELSISMQQVMTQKVVKGLRNLNWQPLTDTGLLPKLGLTLDEAVKKVEESVNDAKMEADRASLQGPTWT